MPIPDVLRTEITEHLNALPHGWCRPEKACRLAEIIIDNKLERIIEIGIFGGRSVVPMALAVRHQNRGNVFGLDPWDVQHAIEGDNGPEQTKWWQDLDFDAIRESFEKHVIKHQLYYWLHWSRFGSVEMAPFWPDGFADLIHLDGDHSELASTRDVALWTKKLKPGGWFVMDDSNWPSQAKALSMLNECFKHIETCDFPDGQAFSIYRKPAHEMCMCHAETEVAV